MVQLRTPRPFKIQAGRNRERCCGEAQTLSQSCPFGAKVPNIIGQRFEWFGLTLSPGQAKA